MAYTKQKMLEIRERMFDAYEVSNGEELKKTDAWQRAMEKTGGNEAEAFNKLLKKHDELEAKGLFLYNDTYQEFDEEDKKYFVKDRGPAVLLLDVEDNEERVKTFWTGKDLEGASPLTPVKVTNLTRLRNLEKGTVGKVRSTDETSVVVDGEPGSAEVPDLHVGDAVRQLWGRRKDFDTPYGVTPDWNWLAAKLEVGGEDDIFYSPPDKDSDAYLRVTAYVSGDDPANNKEDLPTGMPTPNVPVGIRIEMPVSSVQAAIGLDDDSDPEEYKAELQGEEIFVYGPLRVLDRRTRKFFENNNLGDKFDAIVEDALETMDVYKTKLDGTKLRRLNLKRVREEEGDESYKKIVREGIPIGKWRIFDIEEQAPGEFIFLTLADTPTVDCVQREFEIKRGPNKGGTFTKNEGAFAALINRLGATEGKPAIDQSELDFILGGGDSENSTDEDSEDQSSEAAEATAN